MEMVSHRDRAKLHCVLKDYLVHEADFTRLWPISKCISLRRRLARESHFSKPPFPRIFTPLVQILQVVYILISKKKALRVNRKRFLF
jgi:hypothetical protein